MHLTLQGVMNIPYQPVDMYLGTNSYILHSTLKSQKKQKKKDVKLEMHNCYKNITLILALTELNYFTSITTPACTREQLHIC